MPIDVNNLRADKGGDPARWRAMTEARFKPVSLVDNAIELDEVSAAAARCRGGTAAWRAACAPAAALHPAARTLTAACREFPAV
jgi:hypothetical protein